MITCAGSIRLILCSVETYSGHSTITDAQGINHVVHTGGIRKRPILISELETAHFHEDQTNQSYQG